MTAPLVLSIAGFDPSGGAGILADVKTLLAFGCVPTAAVTSLTFQNAGGVFGAKHQTADIVGEQVGAIVRAGQIAAAKTGMLPTAEIVREVARLFRETDLPAPVIDPVLRSTSGFELMAEDAVQPLLTDLMPQGRVVTPNIPEAERFTGMSITGESDMREAARRLRKIGARAVLVKGGHLRTQKAEGKKQKAENAADSQGQAIDVLDDEGRITVFRGEWIDARPVRGTGCMLSAAIAACLSQSMELDEAVRRAKLFVSEQIRFAR